MCELWCMQTLSQFLATAGMTQREFATRVATAPSHINEIISGAKRPGLDLAFAIERATGGAVPATSWVASREDQP